jgi:hypothetical protein
MSNLMQYSKSSSSLANNGAKALYYTNSSEYGTSWAIDGTQPVEGLLRPGSKLPPYHEVVESMADFKRAEKLIKNQLVAKQYSSGMPEKRLSGMKAKGREFRFKHDEFKYPAQGLEVGPPIYRTNNMTYGSLLPSSFEMPK